MDRGTSERIPKAHFFYLILSLVDFEDRPRRSLSSTYRWNTFLFSPVASKPPLSLLVGSNAMCCSMPVPGFLR
jgi:hypothetical protein